MSVIVYLGMTGAVLCLAVFVKWYDPSAIDRLSRETGVSGGRGWFLFLVATLWMFLPFLAGASMDGESELWIAGSAAAGLGFYLSMIAVASVDEYRLLNRTEHIPPERVTAGSGDEVVATSGTPSVTHDGAGVTPFTGVPSVHTDWMVQRRSRMGARKTWENLAGDVTSAAFTLGDGAVTVTSGRHRVFSNAEEWLRVEPDESLPDAAAAFLASHPDLPAPDEREKTLKFRETYVPADEPVTVIGTPRLGESPGQYVIDEAPPDRLFETHADHSTSEGDDPEAILVRGDAERAGTMLRKRVRWLGIGGLVMIVGGQLVAFGLSSATVAAFI